MTESMVENVSAKQETSSLENQIKNLNNHAI